MRPNKPIDHKQWYTMDIHIHTPASLDYQQPEFTYLDILRKAVSRKIDIIAFMDHNTVAGYRNFHEELNQLELLEKLNRLLPEEKIRLLEYRSLLGKVLLLPGFEFTATFGFHIIGLFSPQKNYREIEHILLDLSIPAGTLDEGNPAIGSSVDVIAAYRKINEAGGIVIAAHANSSNGVAMRGMNFGGQTRIAYTQDKNLHALEVTDLDQKGPRATASFFNGTKPEYPRRMHCIQGSDSHRILTDPIRKKNLGIGDRATDVFLKDLSFESVLELFNSNDFSRTRPHRFMEEPVFDFIETALEEGANIIQDFHETISFRGGNLYAVLSDICAFTNTNGGTIYIGVSREKHVTGIPSPDQTIKQLEKEIQNRISPPIHISIDQQKLNNKTIIRLLIPRGEEAPYALDDNKIYIRDEDETNLAVRDEIVTLVKRRSNQIIDMSPPSNQHAIPQPPTQHGYDTGSDSVPESIEPRTGVEVIAPVIRGGKSFYTMRDLRNGNLVKNVTQASARRLWHYAITRYNEIMPINENSDIQWMNEYGMIQKFKQGQNQLFDFILKIDSGYRLFFGVTADGIHGQWRKFLPEDETQGQ